MTEPTAFELEAILRVLPHRPPFLFVDRVTRLDPNESITAERLLRPEEPQFAGHFPGHKIMPGVLVTEALAQTSGLLLGLSQQREAGASPEHPQMFYLAASAMKFTHPAVPGDLLILRASGHKQFSGLHRFEAEATVGRNLIATGTITLAQVGSPP